MPRPAPSQGGGVQAAGQPTQPKPRSSRWRGGTTPSARSESFSKYTSGGPTHHSPALSRAGVHGWQGATPYSRAQPRLPHPWGATSMAARQGRLHSRPAGIVRRCAGRPAVAGGAAAVRASRGPVRVGRLFGSAVRAAGGLHGGRDAAAAAAAGGGPQLRVPHQGVLERARPRGAVHGPRAPWLPRAMRVHAAWRGAPQTRYVTASLRHCVTRARTFSLGSLSSLSCLSSQLSPRMRRVLSRLLSAESYPSS